MRQRLRWSQHGRADQESLLHSGLLGYFRNPPGKLVLDELLINMSLDCNADTLLPHSDQPQRYR